MGLRDTFYLSLTLIAILVIFTVVGYWLIYKKLLKGEKNLSKGKIFLWLTFIGYLIMVKGVTFLNRTSGTWGNGRYGSVNLHFLSTYKEAWNSFNSSNWIFIILNIIMLVPLGILLPLLNKGFRKLKWTFGFALFMTLSIETVQLLTGRGRFLVDDIFNNLLGAIIGYGIVMAIIIILESKDNKFRRVMVYLTPLILVIISFIAINSVYYLKEYGNLPIEYNYKINMENINLSLNAEIEDEMEVVFLNDNKYSTRKVPIYKTPSYNKELGRELFRDFLQDKSVDGKIEVDSHGEMGIYRLKKEPGYSMRFNYNNGSYEYNDYSFYQEVKKTNKDKETVIRELKKLNVIVPKPALFINKASRDEKNIYQWFVNNYVEDDHIVNGNLIVEYHNNGSIKKINNNMIGYKKIGDISIKNKKEIYERFKEGKFNFPDGDKINKIEVEAISLSYALDTKDFYQPVYDFKLKINGEYENILIPAL